MEFVRNAWYVAGWASEFSHELRRVTVLGKHLVMFRTTADAVVALDDRCPHRLLPLSMGKILGDDIQCGYHGLTFNSETGRCIRIPGQDRIPDQAYVETYPVHQRHDVVWVWMGESAAADSGKIFDLPEFTDPGWDAHQGGQLQLKSHYLNVAENLVDPAHVSFVHPTTLGSAASEDIGVETDTRSDPIVAWRWIRDAAPVGFFQEFGGFTGNVDRWHYYYLHLPCTAVIDFGSAAVEAKLAENERNKGVRIFAIHFLTPVDDTHTIDRWMHIRNTARGDEAVSEKMDRLFDVAFAEDKAILEAIQSEESRPASRSAKRPPIRITLDKGANIYRKRIERLIEKELIQKTTA